MKTSLSVIIPTYRRDDSLCRTLQTLLNQDLAGFELIVVDQSPQHNEGTKRYLAEVKDRIIYVTSERPNLPAARNTGVRASIGDIVVFFDDDIRVPPATLRQLVDSYADPRVDGVCGFVLQECSPDSAGTSVQFEKIYRKHRNKTALVPIHDFIGGFMTFRRDVFDHVGYFDEWMGTQPAAWGEDFEFSHRLHVAGRRLFLNPAIVVTHESDLLGGCGKTAHALEQKQMQTLKMRFYSYLKNRRDDGFTGFASAIYRCYRSHILNRSLLSFDLGYHYKRHRHFFQALRFALDTSHQRNQFGAR